MITTVLIGLAIAQLAVSALLVLYRLSVGPSSLDRGVAADVLIAVLIGSVATVSIVNRNGTGLPIILVLSALGFTASVALARLITQAAKRERGYREAEARNREEPS